MKTLITTLILFPALSLCAAAQTTTNVPTVTLSGDPANPLITNHSGKQVIAALIVTTFADKTTAVTEPLFTHNANQFPDGGSELVGEYSRKIPHSFVVGAKVHAVIFADGEFRGEAGYPDSKGAFFPANFPSTMEREMQSMRRLWQMAKAGNWAGVKVEADGNGDGNLYAMRLLFERDRPGFGEAKAVSASMLARGMGSRAAPLMYGFNLLGE